MTSLPVLHLKATSRLNMTLSTDPCETTATLYTFLRSTPTLAERETALRAFLDALHTAPSSGRGALMRRPNHHLVQLMESVAVDGIFRGTPHTLPALARHSDWWVRQLGYGEKEERSSVVSASPSPTQQDGNVVRAADMRHYRDPYSDYEANYVRHREPIETESQQRRLDDKEDAHLGATQTYRGGEGEEPLQYSGSTQPPEDTKELSAQQQHRSYLSTEVSALTAVESDARHNPCSDDGDDEDKHKSHGRSPGGSVDGEENTPQRQSAQLRLGAVAADGVHPVLELIARQVKQAVENPSRDAAPDYRDVSSSSSFMDRRIKSKILAVTSKLDDVAEEVSADMQAKEAEEQAWTPHYSRLKTTMTFIEGLQARLGSAISLYQLQRYERETLQQARVAVQMEALTLQLVLRDVRARLTDAEESDAADEGERELMQHLREVLHPSEEVGAQAE